MRDSSQLKQPRPSSNTGPRLAFARFLAELLDQRFTIPGSSIRIGLDPLIGLIPGIGDTLANLTLRLLFQDLGFSNDEVAFYDIGVGFIAWAVLRTAAGKAREISPLLWIVAAGFLVYFARGWIEALIGR